MHPSADFGIWNGRVEYRYAVLESIRSQAIEGLHSLISGGMEVGGVLYGERRGDLVRILEARQLRCEYAHGPAFELSGKDEAHFRELMKPRNGLRAVGWYGSHTRTGVGLGPNDCGILERFFPERGSVALLVRPSPEGPMEATFHVQGCAEPGPKFSFLPAPDLRETNAPEEAPAGARLHAVPAAAMAPHGPTRRMSLVRWAGAGVCLALFTTWFISLEPDPKAATSTSRIGLQVYPLADRNVRIEWDRTATSVRAAHAGLIAISDGAAKFALPLSVEQLRTGSLTYAQQSDTVDVSMRLETGIEESAQVVGGPPRRTRLVPTATPKAAATQPAILRAAATQPVTAQLDQPSRSLPQPQALAGQRSLKRFSLPMKNSPVRVASLPDPPPASSATVRVPLLAVAPKLPVSLPEPVRSPAKHRSGRMIWTGYLARRGVVEFDGSSATVGSLTGALPGVASKLAVFPAEFKDDGLVVYVTDASRHNRSESPSPSTGWNRLRYEWDPQRVEQITVLEAPNASNQFSRLALRNDRRSCSVIVVDWWTD